MKGIGLKLSGMGEIDGGAGRAQLPTSRKKRARSPNAPQERGREGRVQLKEWVIATSISVTEMGRGAWLFCSPKRFATFDATIYPCLNGINW
jgi:hypothetical protein